MGSKSKLLPELWNVVSRFDFGTVVDLFSGSGVVSYMFKAHGKRVFSNDYMAMSATFTKAMVENNSVILPLKDARTFYKIAKQTVLLLPLSKIFITRMRKIIRLMC